MSESEPSMSQVQVEQKSYQMPPQDGFTVAYFRPTPTPSAASCISAWRIFMPATNYGEAGEPNSSPNQRTSTAISAAMSAIPMDT
jgi:hypothetical protein